MQAMQAMKAKLEAQRVDAQRQLNDLSANVTSASAEMHIIKADLDAKDKELEAAKDKITHSIAVVSAPVC